MREGTKYFLDKIKFEYILTLVLTFIVAYFVHENVELTESARLGLMALIGALSSVNGYMFGIHQVESRNNSGAS